MSHEDVMLSEVKPVIRREIVCDSPYIRYLINFLRTECRMVIARSWGKGKWGIIVW